MTQLANLWYLDLTIVLQFMTKNILVGGYNAVVVLKCLIMFSKENCKYISSCLKLFKCICLASIVIENLLMALILYFDEYKSIIFQLSLSYYFCIYLLVFVTVKIIFHFKISCILKNKLGKSINSFAFFSFLSWPQPQLRCHHKPSNVQYKNKLDQTRKFLKYSKINKHKKELHTTLINFPLFYILILKSAYV